jgi:phage tail-like protein
MPEPTTPYLAFNYLLDLTPGSGAQPSGGFSDVVGLITEITQAEYRPGNRQRSHAEKYPGIYKTGDVTLKRGLISATDLRDWVEAASAAGFQGKKESVVITLLNEQRAAVANWTLRSVSPKRWIGPTLAGKGGANIAIEELVLSAEEIEFMLV